jgi:hypothetical protein
MQRVLYRLRDARRLRDNDAFWGIVMAREHYDSFFFAPTQRSWRRRPPNALKAPREAFALAASEEAAAGAASPLRKRRASDRRDRTKAQRSRV